MRKILITAAAAAVLCSCGSARIADGRSDYNPDKQINVGYGSVSQEELTYSVSQVDIDEREAVVYSSIWEYMRSRVPGVESGPAGPGETPDILIRGKSSINSPTQPLILLDGNETDDISSLSPSDVASVSVLKDASASMYGSRGANGVILITTKSAKLQAEQEAAFQKEAREAARAAREARKAARKAAKQ